MKQAILYILLLFTQFVWSQSALTVELQGIRDVYAKLTSVRYEATYSSYIEGRKERVDVNKGEVISQGVQAYQKFENIEILSNPGYSISINHDSKQIVYSPKVVLEENKSQRLSIDSLLAHCTVKNMLKIDGQTNQMTLTPDNETNLYDIQYNTRTKLISKIVIHFAQKIHYQNEESELDIEGKPRMVVELSNYRLNKLYPSEQFSRTKYLTPRANKYELKASWVGYKLLGDTRIKTQKN